MTDENKYDMIIIGSGMGALATASLLAQHADMKVLLLERHFKPGGFTHVFKRKQKYLFDVGLHYVGDVLKGQLKNLFHNVVGDKLNWVKMNDPFEKFVYPDFTFEVSSDVKKYKNDLKEKFPEEASAIEQYFKDVMKCVAWSERDVISDILPLAGLSKLLVKMLKPKWLLQSVAEYMGTHFTDQKLIAVLTTQWGDYGLATKKATFLIHSIVVAHYFKGGFYPSGGSEVFAEGALAFIKEHGGELLVNHDVQQVLVEDNKVVGVKVLNLREKENPEGFELYAPIVVSNAGAYNTYCKMMPPNVCEKEKSLVKDFYKKHTALANITVYIGFNDDPRKLGFNGGNHWINSGYDNNEALAHDWIGQNEKPAIAYLSFPSLKDPEATHHTADIITFAGYEHFSKWKEQPWKKRDAEYEKLKSRIATDLIDFVNDKYPGFKDIIDFVEVSTPITTEHFTAHPYGSIYGVSCVKERYSEAYWAAAETPIENFYLTGADVMSPGIAGALFGGLITALRIARKKSFWAMLKVTKALS